MRGEVNQGCANDPRRKRRDVKGHRMLASVNAGKHPQAATIGSPPFSLRKPGSQKIGDSAKFLFTTRNKRLEN